MHACRGVSEHSAAKMDYGIRYGLTLSDGMPIAVCQCCWFLGPVTLPRVCVGTVRHKGAVAVATGVSIPPGWKVPHDVTRWGCRGVGAVAGWLHHRFVMWKARQAADDSSTRSASITAI
jgi:hypothetical protein